MPTTFAASSAAAVRLGPCKVTYDGGDLGLTKGGVEFTLSTDVKDVTVDQFGNTNITKYVTGRRLVVKVPMAESTLDRLAAMTPGATLIGTTTKKLNVNSATGLELRALGKALVLHPADLLVTNKSEDVNIAIAVTMGAYAWAYKHDEERIYMVEFEAMPDLTTSLLFTIGDPAAA